MIFPAIYRLVNLILIISFYMPDQKAEFLSRFIKAQSHVLGFDYCGISPARRLDDDARRLEKWLNKGMHGSMRYMENHFDLRVDPAKLVPGAKSVISLLYNYFPDVSPAEGTPKISKYAWGRDYHTVIRQKLNELMARIREHTGEFQGRGFVDSAPVLEKTWASLSGLGWVGKNGNLINKQQGSFFFIATLITDLETSYDDAYAKDFCGSCTKCIGACPTQAIGNDKVVDGSKCISYFTIELKEMMIPENMQGKFDNWIFGCDTCQDVCPWNRFSIPHKEKGFEPVPGLLDMSVADWKDMSEENFRERFRDSPLWRPGYKGLMRNLHFVFPADQKSD